MNGVGDGCNIVVGVTGNNVLHALLNVHAHAHTLIAYKPRDVHIYIYIDIFETVSEIN